jgi:hypothetical protein
MSELKGWWMLAVSVTAGLPPTLVWWVHAVAAMITVALAALVFAEDIEKKPPRYIVVLPTLEGRPREKGHPL